MIADKSHASVTENVVTRARSRKRVVQVLKWTLAALAASAIGAAFFVPSVKHQVVSVYDRVAGSSSHVEKTASKTTEIEPIIPFDGMVHVTKNQAEAIGLLLDTVQGQTEPLKLTVSGRTDYDPNSLNKVRPKFKSLIDKVYVEFGQTVKAGDALFDMFSADLAEAKGNYETKKAQWTHDRAELARSAELRKTNAVSEKEYLSVFNDEQKSGTEAKIAKDKLMVLGLTEAEIAAVEKEDGTKKAKMTLRAPGSGVIIAKNVVEGNLYDDTDVLVTIAPLDHFWVYGYVYPSDASRVALGQTWVIDCPFAGQVHRRVIESITSEIEKETKTVVIRAQIDNLQNKIKADMLVGGYIEIPPPSGTNRTVIPRASLVTSDGGDFVFVVKKTESDGTMAFERRKVRVIHEGSDGVILGEKTTPDSGLVAGEKVATRGSLLLMQMYEDGLSQAGLPSVGG